MRIQDSMYVSFWDFSYVSLGACLGFPCKVVSGLCRQNSVFLGGLMSCFFLFFG